MNIYSRNIPTGGLDIDSNSRDIEANDYRYSLNIRNGVAYVKKKSGATFVKGNTLIPKVIYSYGTPTGNSKTIGSYEDKQTNTIIFMVRNANGQSGIYRYFPQLIDAANPFGEIHQLSLFDFGWKAATQITSINTISGKTGELEYWCDNVRGRKINLTKAELVGKLKTWTCYFPKSSTQFQQHFFFVINPMGSTTPITTLDIDTTAQAQITTIGDLFAYLADAINADPICSLHVTAEACDCKLNIIEKFSNRVNTFFLNQDIKTVPTNWYGLTFTERMFDEAKYPSLLSPLVSFGVNPLKQFNNVKNQVWQFRINLFYDDFEKSVLSPFTQVPVNELVNGGLQIQSYNYLHIDFHDNSISSNLTLVNRISVIARSGNTGVEQEVAQLEICDFLDYNYGLGRWFCDYDFYNDTIANVIDTAYAGKLQDGVPIQNNAQDIVQNRLVKGGILSGEDGVECLDISVGQEFADGDDDLVTISGYIWIYNQFAILPINNPNTPDMRSKYLGCIYKYPPADASSPKIYEQYPQWGGLGASYTYTDPDKSHTLDQLIPFGGFVVYAAGTDNWCVSKQEQVIITSNVVTSITNQLSTSANAVLDAGSLADIQNYLFFNTGNDNGRGIRQRFDLKVKKGGKYVIRIASHWVSFGDVLNKGPMYDMYNGREYQTTSTNVFATSAPVTGAPVPILGPYNLNYYEIEIDTTTAFVLPDGTLFGGEFVIEDQRSVAANLHVSNSYTGYVIDSSAGTSGAQLRGAPRMEYQQVALPQFNFAPNSTAILYSQQRRRLSDHNGYFFFHVWTNASQQLQGSSGVTTGEGILPFVLGWSGIPAINPTLFTSEISALFVGTSILNDLVNNTLHVFTPNNSYVSPSTVYFPTSDFYPYQLLLYPFDTGGVKTHIDGEVLDSSGSPVTNAIAVYAQTGRLSPTGGTGGFSVLIYATYSAVYLFQMGSNPLIYYAGIAVNPIRNGGDVLVYFNETTSLLSNNGQIVYINDFTLYTPTNPYVLGQILVLLANTNPFGKGLKRGGTYPLAIRYQDIAGRECAVTANQESIVYIPFITEDLHNYFPSQYPAGTYLYGRPTLTLTLNFKPPIWAVSYNIMIGLNAYESGYLQWVANQVTYVSNIGYSTAEISGAATTQTTTTTTGAIAISTAVTTPASNYNPPVISSYQAGDASNIYISITNLLDYKLSNPDSVLSYTYKAGDRLRLISDSNGVKYNQLYELEVTGYDTVQNCLIVKNSSSLPELKSGTLFEVLHPRFRTEIDEQVFYEVGESFLCTAPNTPANDHSVNPIRLTCGDTYWRTRQYLVNDPTNFIFTSNSYLIEDANLSDFFVSDSWDIGRFGVADPYFKQTYKETDIIVSNPYTTDSNLNGFNSFEAPNRKSLDKQYGPIQRLLMIGDVLHVICSNKSISDYVGQRVLSESKDLNGPVAISNTFLGTERAQVKDLGTQHPASVGVKDGYIYGLDALRAAPWRDANNGLTETNKAPNSKGVATMQAYFKDLCRHPLWSVTSGIDKYYNEYIITVYQKLVTYNLETYSTVLEGGDFSILTPQSMQALGIADGDDLIIDAIQPNGQPITLNGVAGVIDPTTNLLIITGTNTYVQYTKVRVSYAGQGITIAWAEDKNRWSTFYSYTPECYGMLGDLLYSYKGGELWVHDQNDTRNNFYGVQNDSVLTPVFNASPDIIKVWLSLGIESIQENKGNNWNCEITNDYGQQSKLFPVNFKLKERQWYADFKRDLTTTNVQYPAVNGRVLRSESLEVKMTSDYRGDIILRMLTALTFVSMRTGR